MTRRVPTYGGYLRLDRILDAQDPPDFANLAPGAPLDAAVRRRLHHDEMLFIVVHQAFELWFKLVLHEVARARDLLGMRMVPSMKVVPERDIPEIVAALHRVNEILRVATDQFRIVETMAPTSFLAFREAITPASGFQSVQFRELEILAGAEESRRAVADGAFAALLTPDEARRLETRLVEPTLRAVLFDWLARTPVDKAFPDFAEAFARAYERYADDQAEAVKANPFANDAERKEALEKVAAMKAQARAFLFKEDREARLASRAFVFITSYRHEPLLRWPSALLDALVEFEQGFRGFRFRHARMVERMIGARPGTGGSSGVAYLDKTAERRIFGDLLDARNFLLDPARLPPIPEPYVFRFRFDS
jgi:tryptophan 2,3-dioxygenase